MESGGFHQLAAVNWLKRTDSKEYAQIAREAGAEVPYIRPKHLAKDNSPEFDFVKHAIEWLNKNEDYQPDIVVRMLATTPLQRVEDVDASIQSLISNTELDSTVVIAEARQHPVKALKIVKDSKNQERLVSYFSESGREVTPKARQTYEKAYFRGNVITFRTSVMEETNSLTGDQVGYVVTTQENAMDIDNEIDFEFAEYLIKSNKNL